MLKNPYYQYGKMDTVVPARVNFGEYLLKRMWRVAGKDAFINGDTNESVTYGKLCQEGMNFAVSLTLLGVRKGDTVAICSENRPEFWSVLLGVVTVGGVFTPMNPGYTEGELKHAIKISKPKYIVLSPATYKIHEKLVITHFGKRVILLGNEKRNVISFNDIAVSNNGTGDVVVNNRLNRNVMYEEFEVADVRGQIDTLFILYSSGTTGLSKGVMLTHLNLLAQCAPSHDEIDEMIGLNITPWFHSLGLVGILSNLVRGKTYVYLPKFDVHLYLKTIEKYKMVAVTIVPPMIVAISKAPGEYDLSSVLLVFSGAAPLHKDTADLVRTKFPNVIAIFQGYGMTEATMALTLTIFDDGSEPIMKPGSVGRPVGGTIIKVEDIETRKLLGPNQTGEICAKGVMLMKGYVGKDRKDDFDDEGFLRTGDVGYYDEEGCFFIVDRLKELIKYKGFQVAPAEIEALLLQHEAIRDAGVIGIPHRSAGEVPLAFVALQPGKTVTEKEVQQFVAKQLSNPKHLRGGVRFVDTIPKNPSGKILRKILRQMARTQKSKL